MGEQNKKDPIDLGAFMNTVGNAGAGVSLEQAAYGLGSSIGTGGTAGALGAVGNAGKLILGTARGVAAGLGQARRNKYIQDYYDKKKLEAETGSDTYTPAPQAGNVNYMGGNSYGKDGGIKGETMPLKNFLKSGGFAKPGFKHLI